MMKTILVSMALLLAGFSAQAETFSLTTSGCNAARYCATVYNDADPVTAVTVAAYTSLASVTVYLDGVAYTSADGNAPATLNTLVSITDLTLVNAAGESIVLNATFYGQRYLHRSGHNYWTTRWTLLDGAIAR